ncbi:RNA ligase RtcB family protein [Salmonella enterica]|uniref:3'-phosphate/5'-hydroxy nucleic acid ligase n=1 Tax=Salmonella enterica subsp. salamae TaxID=59202 RepID=A0A6D2GEW0_SALER|nr:RNA ligase RtcB family protein [Salmonella enterica]EAA5904132.1 RNA ligase RtcB family protein [Salmonella enterica subsp. enterica]EDW0468845.1 RNA ligase RtcB family protein [Salmonella enterica subsp. enterica serovar Victoria]ECJ2426747.1 RNA ligase RtcB family protein [Salmonella enterica subsp. salamae]KAA8683436.1 RNA ligase RtcB family protein [Salmonella enterica subsp. salamae]VEA05878.1 Release factor H-coupled RctB [Salmonella enterica subsp. salamae]
MGNYIRPLSDVVFSIASDNLWIEDSAIQQLYTTAKLTGMRRVIGMPDLHPGRGYPIGAAFFSRGRFYPALVGNDIGCGMALWQTDILGRKYNADKLEKRLASLADVADAQWLEENVPAAMQHHSWRSALGSIGGGNHFAELQQVDRIVDADSFALSGLQKTQLLLLVHSGSRGLGQAILRRHVEAFSHNGLPEGSDDARRYLAEHDDALAFARSNRALIARRILQQLKAEGEPRLDVSHNFVEPCTVAGEAGWLHRKGATPDGQGLVIIPGSRGDYSWLVKPVVSEESLFSLAHGAGRKWMRTECKDRLSAKFTPRQLSRTGMGSRVICRDRQLIYEEAPQAYKSIDSVVDCLAGAGLITPVACLRPVLTLKTSGEKSA